MTTSDPSDVRAGARRGGAAGDIVELSIPVGADLVVLARLAAATVASRASFDVEEIEDLRLAVDELCVSLVGEGSEGRLSLRFARSNEGIEVSCIHQVDLAQDGAREAASFDGLSATILDALVDEHGRDTEDGHQRMWLRKRRARPGA